jgi:hypothetical protein
MSAAALLERVLTAAYREHAAMMSAAKSQDG